MYVCICNGITDRQIREAVASGATSLEELHDTLGVASQCGSCGEHALSLINEFVPAQNLDESLFHAVA
ncbi:MAG: bacterioferritin-associated ferredoxin [Halieaceae bacterium]|jgi:bacterioferritin-associated ferredoxin|nr:bacterioferritin-associated ferredoxin [Halieaceae bacterium]